MNSYIITDNGLMVSLGMKPYNIDRSHPKYDEIVEAVRTEDWEAIPDLASVANVVKNWIDHARVTVDADNGIIMYGEQELHNTLTARILRMIEEGFSVQPLVAFLDNLMLNPSKRAVDELYGFLEYGKMPITEDGHFLAYKRVNDNYTSVHDGKTDNSIGKVVEMPRNRVDEDKDRTCSYGLHFCSHEYLKSFSGNKVVVLKINPRDVVSIPTDYNNTKGRACRYEVVGELSPDEVSKALTNSIWSDSVVDQYDEEDADRDFDDRFDEQSYDFNDMYDHLTTEVVSGDYESGYEEGYEDGRMRETPLYVDALLVPSSSDYEVAYVRGYKDGRGHKAKAHLAIRD